ncbi:M4 family metallopeptidase [Streptomyces sp. NPDC093097]|uniref:M4 family metallopeptidase n=1 Tax=Streptomyces sp. NPDC093097 TaxID=3366027 RepID=UPI00382BF265
MKISASPIRIVHDAQNRQLLPGALAYFEGDGPSKDTAVNRLVEGLGVTFDLFWKVYGRNSLDGKGLRLAATVHYGKDLPNAFWDTEHQRVVVGDGDGTFYRNVSRSIEIIGHHLTMGVIEHTARLEFTGQAGALALSLADVFGSLVKQRSLGQRADQADWLMGADATGPAFGHGALRSLKAPGTAYNGDNVGTDLQVAAMKDYVHTREDKAGVLINSGIPAHTFYLVATALGGHAWERAGQIWYDALTSGQLQQQAQFSDFARLTVTAARDRYGQGEEEQAVLDAWAQVQVPTTT